MLSAFSVTNDLASCTRCSGMRSVGLEEFRERVRGRPFRFLLRYHLRRHDPERLRRGLEGSLAVLPPAARRAAREAGDRWAEEIREGELADEDCAALIDRLADRLRSHEETVGAARTDALFDVFEVATLSVVTAAREDEELRSAIGREERSWPDGYAWHLVAATAIGTLLVTTSGPVWTPVLWVGLGLAVLPPVADLLNGSGGTGRPRSRES